MFDDNSLAKPGQVPGNLPTTEPDDMLAGADAMPGGASALDAGILRPKTVAQGMQPLQPGQPVAPVMPNNNFTGLPPELDSRAPDMSDPEPATNHRTLTLILLVLVLAIVGGGGFWVYLNFMHTTPVVETPVVNTPTQPTTPVQQVPVQTAPVEEAPVVVTTTLDNAILDGQPLDTDADGLTDDQEQTLKTNPMSWDTDGDLLSDGDEVNTWQTNPLLADTDADGYKDGEEIRNGYNPKGPGKLFQPGQGPATSSTSVVSTTRS